MITIIVSQQMLYHRRKTGVIYAYAISTALKGVGNQEGSYQTPLGSHRICSKIGEGEPKNTFFVGRRPKGMFSQRIEHQRSDWVLSRILWLTGTQTGINKHGITDTQKRYIYIHGTNAEHDIGQPVSHGCIRMRNDEVIDLFAHVRLGEHVLIKP